MSGGSGGGGTTQTVTNNAPPQQFLDAYQNIVQRAQGVANTPYQQYPGQTVADLSPDQMAGISGIQNAQGLYAPYINTAADYVSGGLNGGIQNATSQGVGGIQSAAGQGVGGIQTAGNTFNPGSIQQFVDPWTQQVVNATQAQFNNANQQQSNNLRGNAVSAGAFGGDREAVAQGVLGGQQQLAQAPVLAQLRSQGYQSGVQAAETQAAQRLQAAQAAGQLGLQGSQAAGQLGLQGAMAGTGADFQGAQLMSGLGQQAHNAALSDAGALLGVGGLEQQQAQAQLNVPYQQWQAELAYPFQTTSWLSGLTTGLGGASGGTSSSSQTVPGPSTGSQVLGAGLAGLGALGQSGAFGNNGWMTGSNGWFGSGGGGGSGTGFVDSGTWAANGGAIPRARGGQIPGFAFGGMTADDAPGMTPVKDSGLDVPDLSLSVVPPATPGGKPMILNNFGQTSRGTGGGPSGGQQAQQAIGTIASIAGIAAMAFSDRRLKQDISRVGKLNDGTPIYRYRYKGEPQWHVGFIADKLEKDHPEAVHSFNGYGMVDTKAATDDSVGMRPHNDNWDGGWHEPKRAAGGSVTGVGMVGGVPHLMQGPPGSGGAIPNAGGLTDYFNKAKSFQNTGIHPVTWNPSMMPPPAPAASHEVLPGIFMGGWSAPAGGGLEGGGGGGGSSADAAEAGSGGAGVGGSHDMGQTELGAAAAGNAAEISGGGGGMGSGDVNGGMGGLYRRGGMIGLADGGDPLDFSSSQPLAVASLIADAAKRYGIPQPLARAYLQQESGMGTASPNIGQITPATAANPGYGMQPIVASDLQDPAKNIDFSMRYMRARGDAAGVTDWNDPSQWGAALKAYNGGGDPNYVANVSRWLPEGGSQYAMADTGTMTDATPAPTAADTSSGMAAPVASAPDAKSSGDPWSALTYAGLGIMGGNSPNAGVNIGRGALAGLQEYNRQKVTQQQAETLARWRQSEAQAAQARLAETSRHNLEDEKTAAKRLADQLAENQANRALRQEIADQGKYKTEPWQQPNPDDPAHPLNGILRTDVKSGKTEFVPMSGVPINKADPLAASFNTSGATGSDVHGEDYLKTINPTLASQVRALAEGRMQFPSGFALKSPYWQNMLTAVSQFDPEFDAVNYNSRAATRKDFTSGQAAKNVTSLNTVMGHVATLKEAGAALSNGNVPMVNTAINWLKSNTGDAKVNNFATAADAVADELEKSFRGNAGAVAGIRNWRERLSSSASPEQQAGAWKMLGDLLDSRIDALGDQYSRGMGKTVEGLTLLSPHAQDAYKTVTGRTPSVPSVSLTGKKEGTAPTGGGEQPQQSAKSQWRYSATGANGFKAYSNDGKAWFKEDGTPIGTP